jgi:hypothetical protein
MVYAKFLGRAKFLGFCSTEIGAFILPGCDATSLGD